MRIIGTLLGALGILLVVSSLCHAQNPQKEPVNTGVPEIEAEVSEWTYASPEDIALGTRVITVSRLGDTVKFEMLTNAKTKLMKSFKLKSVTPADCKHNCRTEAGKDPAEITFKGEAFERITPPTDEDPVDATPTDFLAPLDLIDESGGGHTLVWGKMFVAEGSGRVYLNGEVRQVISETKATLKRSTEAKTKVWTPKAHVGKVTYVNPDTGTEETREVPTALPRFDGAKTYGDRSADKKSNGGQFRIRSKKSKLQEAVVSWDFPGLKLDISNKKDFLGEAITINTLFSFRAVFSTYLFEDCEANGTPSLATHRIDWVVAASAATGDPMTVALGLSSLKDLDNQAPTKVEGCPKFGKVGLTFTPYLGADANDPKDGGWGASKAASWDKKEQ